MMEANERMADAETSRPMNGRVAHLGGLLCFRWLTRGQSGDVRDARICWILFLLRDKASQKLNHATGWQHWTFMCVSEWLPGWWQAQWARVWTTLFINININKRDLFSYESLCRQSNMHVLPWHRNHEYEMLMLKMAHAYTAQHTIFKFYF